MKLLRVENHPELRKDPNSRVVFYVDEQANRKHEAMKAANKKTKSMQSEINALKNDVSDIKTMLTILINK